MVDSSRQAGEPTNGIEITPEMLSAGRESLLAFFPEDVLSWRTAGLSQAAREVFEAMMAAMVKSSRGKRSCRRTAFGRGQ